MHNDRPSMKATLRLFLFFCLFAISLLIQTHLFLNWDICWLMQCADRLWHGGDYAQQFLEINPPMIMFIYLIPFAITKIFSISAVLAFRLFMYVIALASVYVCSQLYRSTAFLLTLLFVFLIFPTTEFGQRENIMMILTMPYFLLMTKRCNNTLSWSFWKVAAVGVIAGIGFAIKPYFLAAFVLAEMYLAIKKRKWLACIHVDSVSVLLVCLLYLAAIAIVTPDYYTQVLPMINELYLSMPMYRWPELLVNVMTFVPMATVILYFLFRKAVPRYHMLNIFILAMLGYVIAFLLQEKAWFYHAIPMVGMALIAVSVMWPSIWSSYRSEWGSSVRHFIYMVMSSLLVGIIVALTAMMLYVRLYQYLPEYDSPHSEYQRLIHYVKKHLHNRRYYYMSTSLPPGGLLSVYTDAKSASRFPHMWQIPGIVNLAVRSSTPKQLAVAKKTAAFMQQAVVEDFKRYHPQLVIVDVAKQMQFIPPDLHFAFLPFYKKNAQFRQIWHNYHFVKKIGSYALYCRRDG